MDKLDIGVVVNIVGCSAGDLESGGEDVVVEERAKVVEVVKGEGTRKHYQVLTRRRDGFNDVGLGTSEDSIRLKAKDDVFGEWLTEDSDMVVFGFAKESAERVGSEAIKGIEDYRLGMVGDYQFQTGFEAEIVVVIVHWRGD